MKRIIFLAFLLAHFFTNAQNDSGFYQPIYGFYQPIFGDRSTIIDISSLRKSDCSSDTTIGVWKSDDIWLQQCSHNWVYAEKYDVNEMFTVQSEDNYCPCGCPYEWKEGRICSVCLRSEIRVISVKNQERKSKYQKLIELKMKRK